MLLNDKVIMITGAAGGIGLAIARLAHSQGAKLLLHDKNAQALATIARQFENNVATICADLLQPTSPALIIATALESFGHLHGLVNCAGIYPRSTIHDCDDSFDAVMQVNVKAPMLLCQAMIQHLQTRRQSGSIVNIGSINAYCGQPDLLVYSMSKGALMTMTRNLADAHGPDKIRINQLNVGWTATETEKAVKEKEGLPPDWQQRLPAQYAPGGSILAPDEIARHVAFWLSDWSAPVSGSVYEVEQYPIIGRNRICDIKLEGSIT